MPPACRRRPSEHAIDVHRAAATAAADVAAVSVASDELMAVGVRGVVAWVVPCVATLPAALIVAAAAVAVAAAAVAIPIPILVFCGGMGVFGGGDVVVLELSIRVVVARMGAAASAEAAAFCVRAAAVLVAICGRVTLSGGVPCSGVLFPLSRGVGVAALISMVEFTVPAAIVFAVAHAVVLGRVGVLTGQCEGPAISGVSGSGAFSTGTVVCHAVPSRPKEMAGVRLCS